MTVVVTGGLICLCGFQIIGVIGWLVRSMIIGWVLLLVWASDCKVFSRFRVAAVFILNFWVFFFFHVDFIIFLGLWV